MTDAHRQHIRLAVFLPLFLLAVFRADVAFGGAAFRVTLDPAVRAEPCSGRLVVYLIRADSGLAPNTEPAEGPFLQNPQPLFGVTVERLAPGSAASVDDAATAFPAKPGQLPPGRYRAQAVLDMHRDDCKWYREPGNLYSDTVPFTVPGRGEKVTVELRLAEAVAPAKRWEAAGAERFEVRSKRLSEFHGRDVRLRAGVVRPVGHDPARRYPAVYAIPGFDGDASGAVDAASRREKLDAASPEAALARSAFFIVLDPQSGNGHTLFVNSDNNGPWADALVHELIPALEAKYNLVAHPAARLLTGHSSGGWASLWLTIQHPETFGGCWAGAPDPVDFRRFQVLDLYGSTDVYASPEGRGDVPSARERGKVTMTVRQENQMEEVLGPGNTSGQQWDSWQAAFGHRAPSGAIRPLYDAATGRVYPEAVEAFRRFDIGDLLRRDPQRFAPILRERVRLVVGDRDTYYLNEGVALLKADLDRLRPRRREDAGYISIVPGLDHDLEAAREVKAFPGEMMEHLREAGHPPANRPTSQRRSQ